VATGSDATSTEIKTLTYSFPCCEAATASLAASSTGNSVPEVSTIPSNGFPKIAVPCSIIGIAVLLLLA
jgi:hypothetical protein